MGLSAPVLAGATDYTYPTPVETPVDATTLPPPARPEDRRGAPRRQPALGTVVDLDAGPDGAPRQGLVWNISLSGVSLLLPEPIDPGTTLGGVLVTTDAGVRLPVRLRIAHVRQLLTGDYYLGAQFDRPLAPDEMRPFVAGGT